MNPGLAVTLRPTGPWRIGPESGARNRVDVIYHSDSLYSAITSAMARMGSLGEWLDATARNGRPAVCFSSCFPVLDEIRFVIPPRTVWPPTSPALMSARVRWKSARFVPLEVVRNIVAGSPPDENRWAIDGPSECLVPVGKSGPFRMNVRHSAAVDRMTGATDRHSTACLEFRPGAGLWTVVSFADDAARDRWAGPVKAAFRLLADSGFGGERSRGWGRSEAPEFTEGMLPEMLLPAPKPAVEPPVPAPPELPVKQPEPVAEQAAEPRAEQASESLQEQVAVSQPKQTSQPPVEQASETPVEPAAEPPAEPAPETPAELAAELTEPAPIAPMVAEEPPQPEAVREPELTASEEPARQEPQKAPAHWLLSLFTPAADDSIDWRRGNYSVLARGGRVESASGWGELKKQVQMITEGSVLYAAGAPRGSAANVAPDGFPHPVFRAGFALAIPLPEVVS